MFVVKNKGVYKEKRIIYINNIYYKYIYIFYI